MICKFCGNEIDNGSDFCFICGQKVEAEVPAFAAAGGEDVYSQTDAAEAAEAPVEATEEAVVAEQDVPVAVEAVPALEVPEAPAADDGIKRKKNGKPKNPANAFLRFICIVLPCIGQLIGICVYASAKKKGNEAKAVAVLNSTMRGLCIWMAVIVIVMFKKYVLA